MGLKELLGRIHEETEEQSAQITAQAKTEAERTIRAAKERVDSIVSQAKTQAERDVSDERLRVVASARLGRKRRLLQAQEDVLRDYDAKILGFIDEFVRSKEYHEFLTRVVEEGVAKIGKNAVVQVNSRDKSLLGGKAAYAVAEKPLECKGGALISSDDGRRRVDNTIESILRERGDELRLKLVEQVFGSRGKESSS